MEIDVKKSYKLSKLSITELRSILDTCKEYAGRDTKWKDRMYYIQDLIKVKVDRLF